MTKHLSLRVEDDLIEELVIIQMLDGDSHVNETVKKMLRKGAKKRRKDVKKHRG